LNTRDFEAGAVAREGHSAIEIETLREEELAGVKGGVGPVKRNVPAHHPPSAVPARERPR
jgi:hypothetical protein